MSSNRSSGANTPANANEFGDKAAEIIQRHFRGFKDRLKVREKAAFNITQLIEFSEEQDHLNLNKFFSRWIKLIKNKEENNEELTRYVATSIKGEDLAQLSEHEVRIEADYTGVHLADTFNQKDFEKMLASFKSNQVLHTKYALMILNKATESLSKLPNVNEINCLDSLSATANGNQLTNGLSDDFRVNVVGDLHGQFIDLFTIFDLNGLPSSNNLYLFNGDFVDRGSQQTEVLLTLLYALVLYGSSIFYLNRGNHEDYGCSVRFGFKEEVMTKYCLYSKLIMKKCNKVFAALPIATIITQQGMKDKQQINKILVVHGGISSETDLNLIKTLKRFNYPSVDGTSACTTEQEKLEVLQIQDLLWSDPMPASGCTFNKQRHIAKQFGPDVTEKVLAKYGLSLLIRSHECKNEGYEFHHNNKCITIFSASNYCGGINKGSICVIRPRQKLEIKQFISPSGEMNKQDVEIFETRAIRGLKRLLYANRALIREEFKKLDPKNTGYLSLTDWANALTHAMSMNNIPWLKYKDKLVECNAKRTMIKYETSFDNCDVLYTFTTEHKDINEALARYKETLVALFNLIDDNHSGTINLIEFANACKIIFLDQNEAISDEAIKSMIEAMDTNKDGKIDLAEFTQAFVIYT